MLTEYRVTAYTVLQASLAGSATASLPAFSLLAVGDTVNLLKMHPPLPLVGFSTETLGECQQNISLAD